MARIKNAKTKYEISAVGETPTWLRLGKWIASVTDSSEDEVEESAYYDGDGTVNSDVTGLKETYDFEGTFDADDPAQAFIDGLKRKEGDERVVLFRVTNPDGATEEGPATVLNIVTRGGEASAYPVFSCSLQRTEKPTITPAV